MKNWNDRELSDRLRRLSTQPPDTAFEQRLSLSLGLAAKEIRSSRLPAVAAAPPRRRAYVRAALLLALALAAAAASQAWLAHHAPTPHAAEPGE